MASNNSLFFTPSDLFFGVGHMLKIASAKDWRGFFIVLNSVLYLFLYQHASWQLILAVEILIAFFVWEIDRFIIRTLANFRPSEWLFFPQELGIQTHPISQNSRHFGARDLVGLLIMLDVFLALFFLFNASFETIFFIEFAICLFFWKLDGRSSIGLALVGLILIVIIQLLPQNLAPFDSKTAAEKVAVWVYFFLVIGVAKEAVDLISENSSTIYLPPPYTLENMTV